MGLSINIIRQKDCGSGTHLHDVMEYVSTDEPEVAVHGCGSTALKVPSSRTVVRGCGVCVLKVGYQYEPVIDPEIRADIITKDS